MKTDRVFIIAEAGVNHNGSVDLALAMIDRAAEAGADAVKFQTFRARDLASANAPKAGYQLDTTDRAESQREMLVKLELDEMAHFQLKARCLEKKIEFLSTPFDLGSLDFLAGELGVSRLKIPSGEITNAPLLLAAGQTGLPVIMSTGMATSDEIEDALSVLAFGYLTPAAPPSFAAFRAIMEKEEAIAALGRKVTLLHCTSEYPAPFESINLLAMDTLARDFNLSVGLSDHSQGIAVAVAAAARGASVIEKHFTLDRTMPGPDHQASLDPAELTAMVTAIRQVEMALGSGEKLPTETELSNRAVVRKSLFARNRIEKGRMITARDLVCLRPGTGLSPFFFWECAGRVADRDYAAGEAIDNVQED